MKAVLLKRVLPVIMVLVLLSGQVVFAAETKSEKASVDFGYLQGIMDLINQRYLGEVSEKELITGILKGIFSALDPYSVFYTPEEAESFMSTLEDKFEGVGIAYIETKQYMEIIKVFPESPAEKAGILPGDRIIGVDGVSTAGMSSEEVNSRVRGPAGTKVVLTILRGMSETPLTFELTRAEIRISPVSWEIRDGIGYIKIEMFNFNTYDNFRKALEEMDRHGVNKLILDLRNNPGGLTDQAIATARHFVPKGLITKLDYTGMPDEEYYSSLEEPRYQLAVLVNGKTASASEILAGAIKDTKAGVLIGSTTFGKATIQQLIPVLTPEAQKKYEEFLGTKVVDIYTLYAHGIIPLANETFGTVKMTVGQYLTPKGQKIEGRGIEPDIEVEDYPLIKNIDVRSISKLTITSKPGLGDESIDVFNAERILALLGYDVDQPDLILDEKTYRAVDTFRRQNGLYPGGVLDFTTQRKLNEKLDELLLEIDAQYRAAVEWLKQN